MQFLNEMEESGGILFVYRDKERQGAKIRGE